MERNYSVSKVFVAACAGIAIFGVAMLALGAILSSLEVRIPGAVQLPKYLSVGIIIGTLLFGPVVDKFGYKWILITASIAALAGLVGLALINDISLLTICIIVLGIGGGILNGETSALVSVIYDDKRRGSRMSIMSSFYCFGALCWTLSCSLIENYLIPLSVAIVLTALFIIYFCAIKFPKPQGENNVSYLEAAKLLRFPALLLFAFVLFFQSGLEGAAGNFATKFYTDWGVNASEAIFTLTMYTLGMFLCRVLLGALIGKVKDITLLVGFLSFALAGTLLTLFPMSSPLAPHLSMFLIGFGCGATFPIILSRVGASFQERTGSAFSAAMFVALCGNYTFNFATEEAFQMGGHMQPLFEIGSVGINMYALILFVIVLAMMLLIPVAIRVAKNFKG